MITETRKKTERKKNHKAVRIGAKCLWKLGLEKKKTFEVGKE